jgi:transposase InsO family protein
MTPLSAQAAAVAALGGRLRADGSPPPWLLHQLAAAQHVHVRTVTRWWQQAAREAAPADAPDAVKDEVRDLSHYARPPARGWALGREHLELLAGCDNSRQAWEHMRTAWPETPSYQTVRSHVRRLDAGLLAALTQGGHGALVRNRLYLGGAQLRRNERWLMDAQEIPVHVLPRRGYQPIKLWQVTALDDATRMTMASVYTLGQPNADDVAACLAAGVAGRTYDVGPSRPPVFVGGLPHEVVWDNGAEFLNDTVSSLAATLGVHGRATAPYAPWEKGKIESWHRTVQAECYAALPGATHGPQNHRGASYFDRDPDSLLSTDLLVSRALAWTEFYAAERAHTSLDGQTPLAAWAADDLPLRLAQREQLWAGMYLVDREHTVNRSGIRFERENYAAPELNGLVGAKVSLRRLPHLPLAEAYLEVFDGDRHVCRAVPVKTMTQDERREVLDERRRQAFVARDVARAAASRRKAASESREAAAFLSGQGGSFGAAAGGPPPGGPGAGEATAWLGRAAARAGESAGVPQPGAGGGAISSVYERTADGGTLEVDPLTGEVLAAYPPGQRGPGSDDDAGDDAADDDGSALDWLR